MTRFSVVIPAYNAAGVIGATITAIRSVSGSETLEIVIVDDASTDDICSAIPDSDNGSVILVHHDTRRGRSAARNTGASASHGAYLLFLDADAKPANANFLAVYEQCISSEANLVFGAYASARHDFWSRYEALSLQRAVTRFNDGVLYAMSSRNFLIERSLFEACAGFDERYCQYGFEDRDLFMRALYNGARAATAEQAIVVHDAGISLPVAMRKMMEAGRFSSQLFRQDHPDAYSRLGYSAIDAGLHPFRGVLAAPAAALLLAMSSRLEGLLQSRFIPFRVRVLVARTAAALSYLKGTRSAQLEHR